MELGICELLLINFLFNVVYELVVCICLIFEVVIIYGFLKENIIFEVVEGEKVIDWLYLINIFEEYWCFGFMMVIDDFGVGYVGFNLFVEF